MIVLIITDQTTSNTDNDSESQLLEQAFISISVQFWQPQDHLLAYGAWFGPKVPIVTIPVEILDFDQSGSELEL